MPVAPPRAPRPRPAARRTLLRGGLAGTGLLVAAAGLTPLVLAGEAPVDASHGPLPHGAPDGTAATRPQPLQAPPLALAGYSTEDLAGYFGTGKQLGESDQLTVFLGPSSSSGWIMPGLPGGVVDTPDGLDLSGAEFDLSDSHGTVVANCVTNVSGACSFGLRGSEDDPAPGTAPAGGYELTQASAPLGLAPVTGGILSVTLTADGGSGLPAFVGNVPQFRHELAVRLDDAGQPLAGAAYRLSGPDLGKEKGPDGYPSTTWGPVVSDADGTLLFGVTDDPVDWFAPGAGYTLTQVTVPAGHRAEADPVALDVRAAEANGPLTAVHHVGKAVDAAPAATSSAAGPAAPAPVAGPAGVRPSSSPAPAAPRSASGGRQTAPTSAAVAPVTEAVPTTEVAPPTVPSAGASTSARISGPTLADRAVTPKLATASSSVPEAGLIGFGVLFVAVVVLVIGVVRRRAGREH